MLPLQTPLLSEESNILQMVQKASLCHLPPWPLCTSPHWVLTFLQLLNYSFSFKPFSSLSLGTLIPFSLVCITLTAFRYQLNHHFLQKTFPECHRLHFTELHVLQCFLSACTWYLMACFIVRPSCELSARRSGVSHSACFIYIRHLNTIFTLFESTN